MKRFKIKDLMITIDPQTAGERDKDVPVEKNFCVDPTRICALACSKAFSIECYYHNSVVCAQCSIGITDFCVRIETYNRSPLLVAGFAQQLPYLHSDELAGLKEAVGDLYSKIEDQLKGGKGDLDLLQTKLEEALESVKKQRKNK
jgi:hypothetical protein